MKAFDSKEIGVQEIFSLGYIYLLILGIISEAIFFRFFDINILRYSSILDVLIYPISLLTENLVLLAILVVMTVAFYYFIRFWNPWVHNRYKHTKWYQKITNVEKVEKQLKKPASTVGFFFFMALMLFSMLIGFGMGSGDKLSSRMKNGELKSNHILVYNNQDSARVRMISQNSLYLFYVKEGERELTITPVGQSIFSIKKIVKKEKEKEK